MTVTFIRPRGQLKWEAVKKVSRCTGSSPITSELHSQDGTSYDTVGFHLRHCASWLHKGTVLNSILALEMLIVLRFGKKAGNFL